MSKGRKRRRHATKIAADGSHGLWHDGTGMVGAGCEVAIGTRLKRDGMRWPLPGAPSHPGAATAVSP